MTDRNKFEQMLEYLINEESDKAKELFHQLVVEKSREIYENILSEDFNEVEESDDDGAEDAVEEDFGFAEADDDSNDGDATDDFIKDVEAGDDEGGDEFGGEEGGDEGEMSDEEQTDRIRDLEDELMDLRAEFEKMMSGEEGEEEHGDMDFGGDEGGEPLDAEESFMREYTEKVGGVKAGDNGVNAKSIVAGKNDMGGTTANILKGGEAKGEGTKGGLLNPSTKEENFGNVNVPGGKAGVKHLKKQASPKGGDDGDRSADSPLNGAPKRAK